MNELQTLTELFEKYGFTKLICPFAVGLYNSAELEIDIEVIIVHNESGENFYRLYAAGEEKNGLLTYYHSFVKNEEELKDFIEKAKGLLPESVPAETLVMQKTADIGITKQPEKPEDMPKTITVLTHDFIQLIMIAGSLCHPEVKPIYKQRIEGDIRKIALRHHINYVGEIKE